MKNTRLVRDALGKIQVFRDIHNASVTIMYPTDEEIVEISEYFAEKLNKTKGPTAFLIPMQGWSAYDQPEERACIENGWAKGNGDGPRGNRMRRILIGQNVQQCGEIF